MSKLASNKYIQVASYVFALLASIFFVYHGLTMSDPQTGSLADIPLTPKGVTLVGLGGGTLWLLWRPLNGLNFKESAMPRIAIATYGLFFFGGALLVVSLREPGDGRYSTGTVIFAMSALLPFLLYGAIGAVVNRTRR